MKKMKGWIEALMTPGAGKSRPGSGSAKSSLSDLLDEDGGLLTSSWVGSLENADQLH